MVGFHNLWYLIFLNTLYPIFQHPFLRHLFNENLQDLPPERAFADFVLCNLVLHLVIMNFLGWLVDWRQQYWDRKKVLVGSSHINHILYQVLYLWMVSGIALYEFIDFNLDWMFKKDGSVFSFFNECFVI